MDLDLSEESRDAMRDTLIVLFHNDGSLALRRSIEKEQQLSDEVFEIFVVHGPFTIVLWKKQEQEGEEKMCMYRSIGTGFIVFHLFHTGSNDHGGHWYSTKNPGYPFSNKSWQRPANSNVGSDKDLADILTYSKHYKHQPVQQRENASTWACHASTWACHACTFENEEHMTMCKMCKTQRI
jgi:hypothetical protein